MSEECTAALTAICGAYLAVAYADGQYEEREENRFLSTLINRPEFSCFSADAIERCCNRLLGAFEANYSAALETVMTAVATIKDDEETTGLVAMAARLAIVADEKVLIQEEHVLNQISEALGLASGSL